MTGNDDVLPEIDDFGILVVVTALVNKFVAYVYQRSKYKLVFGDRAKKL